MDLLLRLLPLPQPTAVRYAITAVLVALSFGVRLGLAERTGAYGFILFVPAIVIASIWFDRGSGALALALSAGSLATVLPWSREAAPGHIAALASFVIVGIGLVLVGEALHMALARAIRAEREKAVLLQEMSHRVRNKFGMIGSIIALQARGTSPETRAALDAVASRVRVIANVHDHLQLAGHGRLVNIREYLEGLCRSLTDALGHLRPVIVTVTADEFKLPPEKALPIGLIVNELVTNAFKYAFPEQRPGTIAVRLTGDDDGITLSVTDDGAGCREPVRSGLGTHLIGVLAAQLGGTVSREDANPGCRASIVFPRSLLDG